MPSVLAWVGTTLAVGTTATTATGDQTDDSGMVRAACNAAAAPSSNGWVAMATCESGEAARASTLRSMDAGMRVYAAAEGYICLTVMTGWEVLAPALSQNWRGQRD